MAGTGEDDVKNEKPLTIRTSSSPKNEQIVKEKVVDYVTCNCKKRGMRKVIEYVRKNVDGNPGGCDVRCSLGTSEEDCSILHLYRSIIHKKALF